MPHDASKASEIPRMLRRWSLLRRMSCDVELPDDLIDTLRRGNVDRVLFASKPLQVKDRCVVGLYENALNPLLVKRHIWGSGLRTLRMAFRTPAARRCARVGLYLHAHGIPTPRPRAYVDHRFGPWTYRSYFISDYIEGTSLYRYIRFGSRSEVELRHVALQVAQIWQRLIELGVTHNDFKPENFIVDECRNVWLIDLEKVRVGGRARRLEKRHVFDVKNFLHIRGWHRRADARAIFAEAFLNTPYREQLLAGGLARILAESGDNSAQVDAELSVLIVCEGDEGVQQAQAAIDSVKISRMRSCWLRPANPAAWAS